MLNNEIHEKHMKNILTAIFTDEIGQFLAFKGGTLVYLNYNLDRFSTDIDLDILDLNQEQAIIERIREILYRIGDVKNETLGKTIHRWMFRYDDTSMNIKVELNKRIWQNNTYDSQIIENIPINCMTPDCIFANKLVALSERFYNRDLYDINFFFKHNFPIQELIIQERTSLSTNDFLHKFIDDLPNNFTESSILSGLGEVLDDKQKSRVKKSLLLETINQINNFLSKQSFSDWK